MCKNIEIDFLERFPHRFQCKKNVPKAKNSKRFAQDHEGKKSRKKTRPSRPTMRPLEMNVFYE